MATDADSFEVDEIKASIFILSSGFIVFGDKMASSWDLIERESFVVLSTD